MRHDLNLPLQRSRLRSVPVGEMRWPGLRTGQFATVDAEDCEPRAGEMFYLWYPASAEPIPRDGYGKFVLCRGLVDPDVFESSAPHWMISFGETPAFAGTAHGFESGTLRTGDMIPDAYMRELIVGRVVGAVDEPGRGSNPPAV